MVYDTNNNLMRNDDTMGVRKSWAKKHILDEMFGKMPVIWQTKVGFWVTYSLDTYQ